MKMPCHHTLPHCALIVHAPSPSFLFVLPCPKSSLLLPPAGLASSLICWREEITKRWDMPQLDNTCLTTTHPTQAAPGKSGTFNVTDGRRKADGGARGFRLLGRRLSLQVPPPAPALRHVRRHPHAIHTHLPPFHIPPHPPTPRQVHSLACHNSCTCK